jgi:hypothetical protein
VLNTVKAKYSFNFYSPSTSWCKLSEVLFSSCAHKTSKSCCGHQSYTGFSILARESTLESDRNSLHIFVILKSVLKSIGKTVHASQRSMIKHKSYSRISHFKTPNTKYIREDELEVSFMFLNISNACIDPYPKISLLIL